MLPMIRLDPQDLRTSLARRAAAGASSRPEAAAGAGPSGAAGAALDPVRLNSAALKGTKEPDRP